MKSTVCDICSRSISNNAFKAHHRSCKGIRVPKIRGIDYDPNRGYTDGSRTVWNKGLSRETNEIVESTAQKNKGKKFPNKYSIETRAKFSENAKRTGLGGYRPHPNKGQFYKETWFDSRWEVKVAQSLDQNNIRWIRPKIGFVWNEAGNKYYPDFFLPEFDVYLDPKNPYLMIKDAVKLENASRINNISVIPLSEDQLNWSEIFLLIKAA